MPACSATMLPWLRAGSMVWDAGYQHVEETGALLSTRMTCGEEPVRALWEAIQPAGLCAGSEHPAPTFNPNTEEVSLGFAVVPMPWRYFLS